MQISHRFKDRWIPTTTTIGFVSTLVLLSCVPVIAKPSTNSSPVPVKNTVTAKGSLEAPLAPTVTQRLGVGLTSVLGVTTSVAAQTGRSDMSLPKDIVQKLDTTITETLQQQNLPSAAVSIWVPGKGQYLFTKGLANLESKTPRQFDQPFRIASNTKTFVATAVLQLVDRGKLSKSDKLSKWYPDFPNANKITVDDLLKMRSGIPDAFDEALIRKYYDEPLMPFSAADAIKLSASKVDQFKDPNQETVYTNVNYILLGEIVRKVTGKEIGVVITENIINKLGLKNTTYPVNSTLPGGLHGYGWNAQTKQFADKTQFNPDIAGAAGAIISDMSDLKTYVRALCQGGLLAPATQAARLRTMPLAGSPDWVRYGEGIGMVGRFCGHTGTIPGFSTYMLYLPEKDAVVLVNVNRLDQDDESQAGQIFAAVTKILFPQYVNW